MYFGDSFILCNNINHEHVFKIHYKNHAFLNKSIEVLPTPTKTKQALFFKEKEILVYYFRDFVYLVKNNLYLEKWASCKRSDKYKVLQKDVIGNLYFTTSKRSLMIVKNLDFKAFDKHQRFEIKNVKGS